MVKREIKNFEMQAGGMTFDCTVPMTLHSVLDENGYAGDDASDEIDFHGAPIAENLGIKYKDVGGEVEFYSEIMIDEAALSARHTFLRLRDIKQPAKLYLNDIFVGDIDGERPVQAFSMKGRLSHGVNRLSLRFNIADCAHKGLIGIFTPPEVLRFSGAIIDRVHLEQTHEDGRVNLAIRVDTLGSSENVRAVATLVSSSGQIYYAGLTRGKGNILISDPLYWWPKGFGVQNLYKLTVNLYGEVEVEDSVEMKIGLRTVMTSKTADGSTLLIGGERFLPMGATYSADCEPDINTYLRKEEASVTSASMAGYNTLVLPADAVRPSERFFELCDIHGIVVIDEINAPSSGALERVARLSRHASYGLLDIVGGDNIEELAERLNTIAPNLEFSLLEESTKYISAPSLPSEKTLRTVVPQGERNLFSKSVEALAEGNAIGDMLLSVANNYPYPNSLSDFAYASALAAAKRVGERIKECRMSLGASGRAVFERLCDSSVAISPSAIDSFARWKPLQYYSLRHFSPVALYAEKTPFGILFSVSNERRTDFIGTIEYRVANSSNITIYKNSEACEFSAMTARKLFTRDLSEYIAGHERDCYLEYYLKEGSSIVSHGTMLFVPEKHFRFEEANIKAQIVGSDRRFSLTLSADKFAKDVEIDFIGTDVVLSDNYIDLTSESPVKISITVTGGVETAYHLNDALKIRSVRDLIEE
ncbi:MAG: hypothetical protein E7676_02135 [Ruminococcaceae bacterium]|nr:hypothetical protein [Oscillospiraceae bacterium]